MKTAIYIEDGVVQLVLTPETEFEKNALGSFQEQELSTQIFHGSFYSCAGGWVRHRMPDKDDRSIILRTKAKDE